MQLESHKRERERADVLSAVSLASVAPECHPRSRKQRRRAADSRPGPRPPRPWALCCVCTKRVRAFCGGRYFGSTSHLASFPHGTCPHPSSRCASEGFPRCRPHGRAHRLRDRGAAVLACGVCCSHVCSLYLKFKPQSPGSVRTGGRIPITVSLTG